MKIFVCRNASIFIMTKNFYISRIFLCLRMRIYFYDEKFLHEYLQYESLKNFFIITRKYYSPEFFTHQEVINFFVAVNVAVIML